MVNDANAAEVWPFVTWHERVRSRPTFPPDTTLAFRLQAWRGYREIPTQASLEKAAGVAHGVVLRLESGAVTDPQLKTVTKLAEALGITVTELVGK